MLRSTRLFALGAGMLTALVPSVAVLIPLVYGASYSDAATLLLPLAAVSTFQTTAYAFALSTYARRDGRTLAIAHVAALFVDVSLALALIPSLEAWGAVIANAYVQFRVDEASSGATSLTIRGQAADDTLSFTSAKKNVSSRPRTAAAVPWSPVMYG